MCWTQRRTGTGHKLPHAALSVKDSVLVVDTETVSPPKFDAHFFKLKLNIEIRMQKEMDDGSGQHPAGVAEDSHQEKRDSKAAFWKE